MLWEVSLGFRGWGFRGLGNIQLELSTDADTIFGHCRIAGRGFV